MDGQSDATDASPIAASTAVTASGSLLGYTSPLPPVLQSTSRSASDRQLTVLGDNAFMRYIYGEDRVGGIIAVKPVVYQGNLILACVWGKGPCQSIQSIQIDDAAAAAGVTIT